MKLISFQVPTPTDHYLVIMEYDRNCAVYILNKATQGLDIAEPQVILKETLSHHS